LQYRDNGDGTWSIIPVEVELAGNGIGESAGLIADRPAAPSIVTFYYATDEDQTYQWLPTRATWEIIS